MEEMSQWGNVGRGNICGGTVFGGNDVVSSTTVVCHAKNVRVRNDLVKAFTFLFHLLLTE